MQHWYHKFDAMDYYPPVTYEKYQISIWKFDCHGIVKIKDKYFTPYNQSESEMDQILDLRLDLSLDKDHIIVYEGR